MSTTDLRSPVAEATNLRRQIRDLQERICESLRSGNGPRPELAGRVNDLHGDLVARFGEEQTGAENWLTRCPAVGITPPGPIKKYENRWTTRCPDCDRIVKVHMPMVNVKVRIGAHAPR